MLQRELLKGCVLGWILVTLTAIMPSPAKAGEDSCHFPRPFRVVDRQEFPASIHDAIAKDGLDDFWVPHPGNIEEINIGAPVSEIGWQREQLFFVWTLSGDVTPPFRIISMYRVKSADGSAVLVKRASLKGDDATACRETMNLLRNYGGGPKKR